MTAARLCTPAALSSFGIAQADLSNLSIHANWALIGLNAWSVPSRSLYRRPGPRGSAVRASVC